VILIEGRGSAEGVQEFGEEDHSRRKVKPVKAFASYSVGREVGRRSIVSAPRRANLLPSRSQTVRKPEVGRRRTYLKTTQDAFN
jgi:hypothetical protein